MTVLVALLMSLGLVVTTVGATAGRAAAAAGCDLTWARGTGAFSNAQFADPTSWQEGGAPTSSTHACIPANVRVFVDAIAQTLGTIDIDPTSSLTLFGGTLTLTSTSSIAGTRLENGAVLNAQGDLLIPAGRTANVDAGQSGNYASATGGVLRVDGTLDLGGSNGVRIDMEVVNSGRVVTGSEKTVAIGGGRTFENQGLLEVGAGASLATVDPNVAAVLHNASTGTIEFTGRTSGASDGGLRDRLQLNNDGVVKVLVGDVALLTSGTSTGTWQIGAPDSPSCASPVGAAPNPAPTARLFFRSSPTMTFSAGSVGGPGCVTVFGGTVDVAAGVPWTAVTDISGGVLHVHGDRTLPQLRIANGGKVTVDDGTATASGSISQIRPGEFMAFGGGGTLRLPPGVPLVHVGFNGLHVQDSLHMQIDGPFEAAAAVHVMNQAQVVVTSDWTLHPTSSLAIDAGATLRNEGRLTIDAGAGGAIMFGGATGVDNIGTIRVATGIWDMRISLQQFQAGRLTAGRIEMADGTNAFAVPAVTSLAGQVRLEGSGHLDQLFGNGSDALAGLATIEQGGALELAGGASHQVAALTVNGRLALGASSRLTTPTYTQTSTGTLATVVGTSAAGTVVAGTAELDGTLEVSPADPAQAAVNDALVIDAPSVSGSFSQVSAADGGTVDVINSGAGVGVAYVAGPPPAAPTVSTPTASITEGTGPGSASHTLLIDVVNPNSGPLPLTWTGVGLTATVGTVGDPGVDATVLPGSFLLAPGLNVVPVQLLVATDSLAEPDETLSLLWAPGGPPTTVTIIDDDDPPPVLTFEPASFVEASGGGDVTVTRNSAKAWLTVAVDSVDGTATAGSDYTSLATTVSFAPGQLQSSVHVTVLDDSVHEPDETFTLSFATGTFIETVAIVDDDPAAPPPDPTFSVSLTVSGPFAESVGDATLILRLDHALTVPMTLDLSTIDGTATSGEDYQPLVDAHVTVPAGQTEAPPIKVRIIDDTLAYELADEFFAVVVSRLGVALDVATVDILNDDADPQARFVRQPADAQDRPLARRQVEGNTQNTVLPLFVELAHPATTDVVVTVDARSVAATLGGDYTLAPTTLVFHPGDTRLQVTFTTFADTTVEPDELVVLGLHTPAGDLVGRVDDEAQVTIVDDDQSLTLTPSVAPIVDEAAGSATVTITADHAPGVAVTVPIAIVGVTATLGADLDATDVPSSVTIAADATTASFTVPLIDDTAPEPDEVFRVLLGPPNQGKLVDDHVDVTIRDDDPLPFRLSVADVTVTEHDVVRLRLTAIPAEPGGTGTVTLPVSLTDGSAVRGLDYVPANGTNGSVTVPAAGGTVTAFVLLVNDTRYELTETFQATFGRAQVSGEAVSATVTVLDDDPLPAVSLTSSSPYAEDAGQASMSVRLAIAAGTPLTFHITTRDETATDGSDYVGTAQDVTVPAGASQSPFFSIPIIDDRDSFDVDLETFGVVADLFGTDVAATDVGIIDNDTGPQARLVRQPSDPAAQVLTRHVVEGTTANTTLPLQVELLGDPVTTPVTVTVVAQSATATSDDFTVTPLSLVFQPGDGPKTVTFTSLADSLVEGDDLVVVALQSDVGNQLGRVDDEVQVTIVDDDGAGPPPAAEVAAFQHGWDSLVAGLGNWLRQFDLGSNDAPPVATRDLAQHFGLGQPSTGGTDPGPRLPSLDPADSTLPDLCADLQHLGFTIDFVAGGVCGLPAPGSVTDVIQARYTTTLAGLARAAGFSGDPLDPTTPGVLQSLAGALGLQGTGGWTGDLTVTLVVGVDASGFYVEGGTRLQLHVGGGVDVGGTATVAGSIVALSGSATADLTVSLAPPVSRERFLGAALTPTVTGAAHMTLGLTTGPLALMWAGDWSMTDGTVAVGAQVITGSLRIPGLADGSGPAAIDIIATLHADGWHIDGHAAAAASLALGGFVVAALDVTLLVSPTSLSGGGSLRLSAPLPGGDQPVDLTVTVQRDSIALDGTIHLPSLDLGGSPVLLSLVDPFVHAHFSAALPAGPLAGSVDVGAASATLLPATPAGTATGITGSLTSAGDVTLHAASLIPVIAGGAITATVLDATFRAGPHAGAHLVDAGTVLATIPSLGGLQVTFDSLFLATTGAWGASSVTVASNGFAALIGLGGILPFDVTSVTVAFPDPTNLDHFDVQVVGRFDFARFPSIPGVTFHVGLGGPVVTASSPPEQNRFAFSVDVASLAEGRVAPLDVGPITLGFDGLPVGDAVVGADITLGGFAGGVFQPDVGGSLRIDGPAGSLIDALSVQLGGTITGGAAAADPTVADITGRVQVSGSLGPLRIDAMDLRARVLATLDPSGLTLEPHLDGLTVGALSFAFGDVVTLRASGVSLDLSPPPGGDLVRLTGGGGLSVEFDPSVPALGGFGGSFTGIAIGADLVPRLLPGFAIDVTVPPGTRFGLPDFLPLHLDHIGMTFPGLATPPADGLALTPELLAGMRLRVSGGIDSGPTWPISASVDGLEVDLGRLANGQFPITDLDGLSFGIQPFELPGGVVIGGALQLGTIDAGGTTVFYGRIAGEMSVSDIGGGVDLVVTQYGPVLMKVHAPLGIPLGPTGIVLSGAEGAAQFGSVGVPVPPPGDPDALLHNLTLPTDVVITTQTIADAVLPAVQRHTFTWDQGFALSLAGDLIVAAAPGVLKGRVTVGMNLGLPTGPSDPAGLQLVGRGDVSVYGIPLGEVGMLLDLADPLAPSFDLAFASPAPGSPLSVIFPARGTFGVQLRTDGVVLGTVEGLRTFTQELADGTLATGGDLFQAVLAELASQLESNRTRALATLLLDLDGDGSVSPAEGARTITSGFVLDRVLGRNGVPALLPAAVSDAALGAAAHAATAVLQELLLVAGQVLEHPERFGSFALGTAGDGFQQLTSTAGKALAALGGVIRQSTRDALAAFGARFNPSLTIDGALQPTLLGLPLGSPLAAGRLTVDRTGLFFELRGSLVQIGQQAAGAIFPLIAPAIDAAMSLATLGLSDDLTIGARLPFGGVIDALLGGGTLPTFQPLDPNWAVTFSGTLDVLGFPATTVSGIAFLPDQQSFLDQVVQKVYGATADDPIDPSRIPISSQAHYDELVRYGGILLTASLQVPRLVTDPAAQLAALPAPPADPTAYLAWLNDLAAAAAQVDSPARLQFFMPGLGGVTTQADALDWAASPYVEGVWDGKVLGLDLGRATMALTPQGLQLTGTFPLVGATGTVTLNTALLSSGQRLPSAGLDISLDAGIIRTALTALGVPSSVVPPATATGHLRAYSPGFDPAATDPLLRNGGLQLTADLDLPGLVSGARFDLTLVPRPGGYDVHGAASVAKAGPIGEVVINGATVRLDIVNGVTTVHVSGAAAVLGAQVGVDGDLAGDLTGRLKLTVTSGAIAVAGVTLSNAASLTATLDTTRINGVLVGSIGLLGTATLPAWLATATQTQTLAVGGCVDSAGNAELAVAMPAMRFGPTGLVRVGRNPTQATLPASPAACTIPAGAPAQAADGPLVRLRVSGTAISTVLDGSLQFAAPGATVVGLSVTGSLSTLAGTGTLAVAFTGGNLSLSGFVVAGSATATITPGTFSMRVTGQMSAAGLFSNATVGGTATEQGITHLGLSVGNFTLPPLTVNSFTIAIDRTPPSSVYSLTVTARLSFAGIGVVNVTGSLDSLGNGSLGITTSSLTISGATITNGVFSFVRSAGATSLTASGRFGLFGASLEVVTASLTLSSTTGITGSLVIRPPGGAPLSLGGWAIGGTLSLAFAGTSATIGIQNGTITIPGWGGTVGITASISVPVQNGAFFQLALPAGGLRLGAAPSPFFANGTFRLSFTNNVATLAVNNPRLTWRDGATEVASLGGQRIAIASNGAVSAALDTFSATLPGGFAFTVPALNVAIDALGLNARLALGAGSVSVPGFPALTTPTFTLSTTSFTTTLVANVLDLGFVALRGTLVFERQSGVFRLRFATPATPAPSLEIEGLVTVPLPSFSIASDGTFAVDAQVPSFGPSSFRLVGASMHLAKTGGSLSSLSGQVNAGKLLVANAAPITLPALAFDSNSRVDETFVVPSLNLGPFLQTGSVRLRFRSLATGVEQLTVVNSPSLTALAGSTGMQLTALTAESDGTFTGAATGRLALFGVRLASATFTLSRQSGRITLTIPASSPAGIDLGFLQAGMSGFFRSDGSFSFTGSTSVSVGVTGFSLGGSVGVTISSAGGIEGSYSGQVCIGVCASTTGSLRSDGRIAGLLRIDLNGDGDFVDFGELNAAWFVYLATGGVAVDLNNDGDFADLGDFVVGTTTSADTTAPTMATPANVTVRANIAAGDVVLLYYTVPTATDSGIAVPVSCTPPPGSSFAVGPTTVSCSATDAAGNTRTRSFTVTVQRSAVAVPTTTSGVVVLP